LSRQVLPLPIKQKWQADTLSAIVELPPKLQDACRSLCRYMMAADQSQLFPRLVKYSQDLDQLRGEHLEVVCPDLVINQTSGMNVEGFR
jgi:hypothetical protein